MTEAEWQASVVDLARILGWRHMHARRSIGKGSRWTTATNVTGWPDLVLWSERQQRVIFAELKTDTGKLTTEQVEVLRSLRTAGAECHVWRPAQLKDIRDILIRGQPGRTIAEPATEHQEQANDAI